MKYIATVTDGSFPTNSAVIQAPLREAFAMAKAAGYDGLQLTIRDTTDYDIAQLQALMQETGLEITALATGRIYSIDHMSLGAGDESVRQGAVARMNKIAAWSVPLGCPGLVIGAVRGNYSDAGSIDLYMSQLEKSVREIVAYCEPLKVPVILEVIDRNESRAFCDPEETGPSATRKRPGSLWKRSVPRISLCIWIPCTSTGSAMTYHAVSGNTLPLRSRSTSPERTGNRPWNP